MTDLIKKLVLQQRFTQAEFVTLIESRNAEVAETLAGYACEQRRRFYGNQVYIRGLIEFTNYCKNDCFYCGLRRSNRLVKRYRLDEAQILDCCRTGYELGLRTFVLQGGEDLWYTPSRIEELVRRIKKLYPDCAVTLSVGEHPKEAYQSWFDAGADRYLLRHETADPCHYGRLHPAELSLERRMQCLRNLKEIGYQVGCGFMVGSPGQTPEQLAQDLFFIQEFQPHMVGIGPFIPQKDTPFGTERAGDLELTLFLLSVIRLILPQVLLPSTTALGTIHPQGRERGFLAGANVCMPNLSPLSVRKQYALYDNKISTGAEAAECLSDLRQRIESVGCCISMERGDHVSTERK